MINRFIIGLLLVSITALTACSKVSVDVAPARVDFNAGWEFTRLSDSVYNERSIWQAVSLPHTPQIEPLVISEQQWQGTCVYRKVFDNPSPEGQQNVALRFGAAMHDAKVILNGKLLKTHHGGYLPFVVDLTENLVKEQNTLVVELNNEDNKDIPPGKAIAGLDFNYYGGLYRGVELLLRNKIYISDPVEAGKKAGGGVYLKQKKDESGITHIRVNIDVVNTFPEEQNIDAEIQLFSPSGSLYASYNSEAIKIEAEESGLITLDMILDDARLWSPSFPELYMMEIAVKQGRKIFEKQTLNFGVRDYRFDSTGFYLNGRHLRIRGTNRHQEYPYVGYAIGPNADYRDALKIKDAGFNFVRLSHYPHSEAFLDACDKLGILVMDAIPGWQFAGDSLFLENSKQDLRDMIRRDRNHPSIVLWEASLNESWMPYGFIEAMHQITKEELEGNISYSCGWMDTIYDVYIPARQHAKPPHYWNNYSKNKAILIAEYGDWEYYAQNAGFNQKQFNDLLADERTSRQLRGAGQKRLAQQALNYQEAHNDNLKGSFAGDANWLMFDYNRGYAPDIESSGIMDIFRLPKFAYYFYSSQKDLNCGDTILFIANYWNDPVFTDLKVFSNCDSVELWLNNDLVAARGPDNDSYSDKLAHPPFTFENLSWSKGELKAIGFVEGKKVKEIVTISSEVAEALDITIDYSTKLPARGSTDILFVYASVKDNNGSIVYNSEDLVEFTLEGSGELIGENPAKAEAGIATILYKSNGDGNLTTISVRSENLKSDTKEITKSK